MYTANLKNLLNYFENQELPSWKSHYKSSITEYDVKTLEDEKIQLTLSVLGHAPEDITLEVTDDKVSVKATKKEDASSLVQDIDATFSIDKTYDTSKVDAKFTNGLLTITIGKKEEKKAKKVTIKVG
jgi:HSP20 family protein